MRGLVSRYFNQGFIGIRLRESIDEVIEERERVLERYFHSTFVAAVVRTLVHAIPFTPPDPLLLGFVAGEFDEYDSHGVLLGACPLQHLRPALTTCSSLQMRSYGRLLSKIKAR